MPICPVVRTWVPPHSSIESPICDDPHLVAVLLGEERHGAQRERVGIGHLARLTGAFASTRSFTSRSIASQRRPARSARGARSRNAAGPAPPAIPAGGRACRGACAARNAPGGSRCGCARCRAGAGHRPRARTGRARTSSPSVPLTTRALRRPSAPGRPRSDQPGAEHAARVAHLPARFGIERILAQHQVDALVRPAGTRGRRCPPPSSGSRRTSACRASRCATGRPSTCAPPGAAVLPTRPGRARALPLLLERALEAGAVHSDPSLLAR